MKPPAARLPREPVDLPGLQATLDLLGGKWTLLIIHFLMDGPKRFGELRCLLPTASAKMVTQRLHDLEAAALIERRVTIQQSVHVEYHLTPKTMALRSALDALRDWGRGYNSQHLGNAWNDRATPVQTCRQGFP